LQKIAWTAVDGIEGTVEEDADAEEDAEDAKEAVFCCRGRTTETSK
jgi:hypothetical protein